MPKIVTNPPNPRMLMQSLRSIGYTFQSALADIIDNSVSNDATQIDILFPSDPKEIFLAIIDNGSGMTKSELYDAMRYGSSDIEKARKESDLGRFGMGLKSASLSQCKKLTVVSKKNGIISAYCWDLDLVISRQEWSLKEFNNEEILKLRCCEELEKYRNGTIVLWEEFDFFDKTSNGYVYTELSKKIHEAIKYISLIFHRFIEPNGIVKISVNNFPIEPLDPFLESHKKTETRKKTELLVNNSFDGKSKVYIQPFILPFQKDLTSHDVKLLGGLDDMKANQGFYVYRCKRLIVWGTWFKMRPRNELTKYARIKVDIPNSLDDFWGIDIKKQKAVLPPSIENNLITCVEKTLELSHKKNTHRARIKNNDNNLLWHTAITRDSKTLFKINRNSPVLMSIKESMSEKNISKIEGLLDLIEASIPYQDFYNAVANNSLSTFRDDESKAILINLARIHIEDIMSKNSGKTKSEALSEVIKIQPFSDYDFIKKALLEEGEE